jgi:hypothetical protein
MGPSQFATTAIEIQTDQESDTTFVSLHGFIAITHLVNLHAQLSSFDPPPARVLIDLQKTNFGLSYADVESFARLKRACAQLAVYAPRPLVFGLSRMYQMLSTSGGAFAVFSDRDKALEWLRHPE